MSRVTTVIEVAALGSMCGAFVVSRIDESLDEDEDDDEESKPSIEINSTQLSSSASGAGEAGISHLWDEDRIDAKATNNFDCLAAFLKVRSFFEGFFPLDFSPTKTLFNAMAPALGAAATGAAFGTIAAAAVFGVAAAIFTVTAAVTVFGAAATTFDTTASAFSTSDFGAATAVFDKANFFFHATFACFPAGRW
jgi:hypothetical protein